MKNALRILLVLSAALALATPALAGEETARSLSGVSGPAPQNLHGFLLKSSSGGDTQGARARNTFPRTPAFAWEHVKGAQRYQFQISTSRRFSQNAIIWEGKVRAPVITVPLTLPWVTGAKYSFFARVRPIISGLEGAWSSKYGFNIRTSSAPRSLSAGLNPQPGMVRWTPVDGATAYEVVFLFDQRQGKSKKIRTATTAADLREVYTFHNGTDWANVVHWRVRAIREVFGATQNKLPVVSYGPWSARNRTVEPAFDSGPMQVLGSISRSKRSSDVVSTSSSGAPGPGAHTLVPGFWWRGARGPFGESFGACPSGVTALIGQAGCPLFHVYVFTDSTCVNAVHTSDLIGSPAYVPRLSAPLALPKNVEELVKAPFLWLGDGDEGRVFDAGGERIFATGVKRQEDPPAAGPGDGDGGAGDELLPSPPEEQDSGDDPETLPERRTGLWDNDNVTGRYYWTAVPAVPLVLADGDTVEFHDVNFAQDACSGGNVLTFGKTSEVVTTGSAGVPFASGLSVDGKLTIATAQEPRFFGRIVIAWKPTPGARSYEVQWSRTKKRWRLAGRRFTPATQVQLKLGPGKWYYRIRGLDPTIPGASGLSWSDPVGVTITAPEFSVVARS